MPSLRSIPRSGASRLLLSLLLLASACVTRYGFAGGGLPDHVHTMAIVPFDNETATPELSRELYDQMHREMQPRLGVRDAPEKTADAVAKGIIRIYDVDIPVAYQANQPTPTAQRRRLQITLDVQIIDQTTGRTLFERKGLHGEADYPEGAEALGRREAIRRIVNDLIEGAQSQW